MMTKCCASPVELPAGSLDDNQGAGEHKPGVSPTIGRSRQSESWQAPQARAAEARRMRAGFQVFPHQLHIRGWSLHLQLRQAKPGRGGESATLKPLSATQRVPNPAR
jgi:hypothetical protein